MQGTEIRVVDFHGDQIVTFEHEGTRYVAMRRIVENMALDWAGQHHKLVAQGKKFGVENISTRDSLGREQQMLSIPVEKLALWLASLNPNRIKSEAIRAKVERYQAESAIALHEYWTKGVAVRGDLDGLVTGIDKTVMSALGGMVKGILHRQLTEIVPALVEAEVTRSQFGTTREAVTAGQVCDMAKVERKGRRGLVFKVSNAMRRYCARHNIAPREGCLGASRAYVFPVHVARDWLETEGRDLIARYQSERSGQMSLRLVK